jgi:hypothetical protein
VPCTAASPGSGLPGPGDLPVGQVDDALVLDVVAVHLVGEAVEDPRRVGPRIVRTAGSLFRCRPTGEEAAVADRAQHLAQRLGRRVEAVVAP